MTLRSAATVILLRPDPSGWAVFLVQRNRRVGFMPSAWVFPGGRVDPSDALPEHPAVRGGEAGASRMGLSTTEARPFQIAAFRETFEESGIWLGPGEAPSSAREALNAGQVGLVEIMAQHGLSLDLDTLIPWSWWVTPLAEPRRYDTRFFVAMVDTDEGRHDDGETVASAWMPLAEAVDGADAGRLPMAPPTWWTLRQLAQASAGGLDALHAAARPGRAICPILRKEGDALELILPGHAEHTEPPIEGLPKRISFGQGRWWADR